MSEKDTIICGTDFSPLSREAANVAAALARRREAKLIIAHVVEASGLNVSEPRVRDLLFEYYQEQLQREVERLKGFDATAESDLLTGAIDESIVDLANRHSARLVVVSSLGHRKHGRWLVGSVAERVAESSPIPTLVVRSADPFTRWIKGEAPLKVLIGVDLSDVDDSTLRWLKEWQGLGNCELIFTYVNWPPTEQRRLGTVENMPLTGNLPEVQENLENELRRKLSDRLGHEDFKLHVEANWGKVEPQLIHVANSEQVDLIVVGTHQRHGLGRFWHASVSRGLLHHAETSLVCVPLGPSE